MARRVAAAELSLPEAPEAATVAAEASVVSVELEEPAASTVLAESVPLTALALAEVELEALAELDCAAKAAHCCMSWAI